MGKLEFELWPHVTRFKNRKRSFRPVKINARFLVRGASFTLEEDTVKAGVINPASARPVRYFVVGLVFGWGRGQSEKRKSYL